MAEVLRWVIGLALLGVLLWLVPLVHITRLDASASNEKSGEFEAGAYAERLWSEALTPRFARAHEASDALDAIESDPGQAREAIGRTVGVSRGFMLFVQGRGRIVSVDRAGVAVAFGDGDAADIVLQTGPIFGNAVRDAPGMVEAKEVANSQDFNDLSAELNRIAERKAAYPLAEGARPGRRLSFVACAEVKDPQRFARPLKAAPVSIELE
ncbi:hypothetical protein Pla175_38240 [Pirellulimonas nuda]|uniref:Periplasmic lipoprotein n=1 Tax=Pirellulimonas nuda TaxID=2528009 RepID=A0A518DG10_9BACT|nr:DUF2291 family protein [Pirellulimonas nuda]QDU90420.1 hypothetical protein Pla175_38240 [Pirellulimonas nuda]